MATRLIGTDSANPRLPAVVIAASQGNTAADLAPGNWQATADARYVNVAGDTMTDDLIIGAAPESTGPTAGIKLFDYGLIQNAMAATAPITNPNFIVGRGGATGGSNGAQYVRFDRSGAVIGAITIATATTVAYGTSSDKRIKTLTRRVDPDEAVAKLAAVEPVNFYFTDHPGDGEQVGFFAQDLQPVAPEVVSPGHGEPGDDDFVPLMVDLAKLVPTLVAAVQALTRRIEALEGTTP